MKALIVKGEFELLELQEIYETVGALYEMAEQTDELLKAISAGLTELEEKIAELLQNAESLMDDLGPDVSTKK